jgi:hypothetical protein
MKRKLAILVRLLDPMVKFKSVAEPAPWVIVTPFVEAPSKAICFDVEMPLVQVHVPLGMRTVSPSAAADMAALT